jgi:hypothetical protein
LLVRVSEAVHHFSQGARAAAEAQIRGQIDGLLSAAAAEFFSTG